VREFFSSILSNEIIIAWEPRGTWNNNLDKVEEIVNNLGIIHVVDPFKRWPVSEHKVVYFRLHGNGSREINYRYKYTDEDLKWLRGQIQLKCKSKEVYVMFNNIYMGQDALRFKELITQ